MTKSERETQVKAEAIKELREYLPAGSTVYTILRDVSRSGMSRRISVVTFKVEDMDTPHPLHLTSLVSRAIGWRIKEGFNDALVVGGCGMDMGEHLVQTISRVLYDDAYDLKQRWL